MPFAIAAGLIASNPIFATIRCGRLGNAFTFRYTAMTSFVWRLTQIANTLEQFIDLRFQYTEIFDRIEFR